MCNKETQIDRKDAFGICAELQQFLSSLLSCLTLRRDSYLQILTNVSEVYVI